LRPKQVFFLFFKRNRADLTCHCHPGTPDPRPCTRDGVAVGYLYFPDIDQMHHHCHRQHYQWISLSIFTHALLCTALNKQSHRPKTVFDWHGSKRMDRPTFWHSHGKRSVILSATRIPHWGQVRSWLLTKDGIGSDTYEIGFG